MAVSALLGAIVFVVVQRMGGMPQNIAEFIGAQVVKQGGYPQGLRGVIGWGVHLGVAASYVVLFAALMTLPFLPRARMPRWVVGLALASVFAKLATLVTSPAIGVTISVLSGKGFPTRLAGLNPTWGIAFWDHLAFFLIALVLVVIVPDVLDRREPARS